MRSFYTAVLLILIAAPIAAHNGKVASAYPVNGIVLDGDFSDWPDGLPIYTVNHPEVGDLPRNDDDLSATFRVAWDRIDGALYLGVDVRDDSPVLGEADLGQYQQNDGLEVYFGLDSIDGTYAQETLYGTSRQSFNNQDEALAEIVAISTATGRRYEVRIDLARTSGGTYQPAAYDHLSFDLAVCDKDEDGTFSWIAWGPKIKKYGQPERMGDVLLLERPLDAERVLGLMEQLLQQSIAEVRDSTQSNTNSLVVYTGYTGVLLTVSIIHLLLALFKAQRTTNLYYTAFSISVATSIFVPLFYPENIFSWLKLDLGRILASVSFLLASIFGLLFLYTLFLERIPRHFWMLLAALFCTFPLRIYSILYPEVSQGKIVDYIFPFFIVALTAEILRVLILALIHRRDGARIISAGVFTFIASALYAAWVARGPSFGLLSSLLLPVLSVSVLLARNVGRTYRTLDERTHQLETQKGVLEQALVDKEQAQEALVRSESMAAIGTLVAGAAHELNNPIGAASSLVQTVREMVEEDTAQELEEDREAIVDHLNFSHRELNRAKDIVASLLDLSRQSQDYTEAVELKTVVQDALRGVQGRYNPEHLSIEEDHQKDLPSIQGNFSQLVQVALNLIENAIDAQSKGQLSLGTYADGDHAVLTCRDTGSGISDQVRQDIFKPFFTTKAPGEGTGLGLYVCHQIVERHGGSIEVDSAEGQGTTFKVRLPIS